jgi:hypothetical protein
MLLQPFASYQLGNGWFLRAQPVMVFNWKSGKQLFPLDLGVGRVQDRRAERELLHRAVLEPRARRTRAVYGITVGAAFLYPDFWRGSP